MNCCATQGNALSRYLRGKALAKRSWVTRTRSLIPDHGRAIFTQSTSKTHLVCLAFTAAICLKDKAKSPDTRKARGSRCAMYSRLLTRASLRKELRDVGQLVATPTGSRTRSHRQWCWNDSDIVASVKLLMGYFHLTTTHDFLTSTLFNCYIRIYLWLWLFARWQNTVSLYFPYLQTFLSFPPNVLSLYGSSYLQTYCFVLQLTVTANNMDSIREIQWQYSLKRVCKKWRVLWNR